MSGHRAARWLAGLALVGGASCAEDPKEPASARPNVLFVVWDTVRADRLSLYGAERDTTPRLAEWAQGALVFEHALASASSTVPTHASMFTGLLPTEHGASNAHPRLDDVHVTLAELLRENGYQTYLWAANPHISKEKNFNQGFDVEEHPWSPQYRAEALRIVTRKLRRDEGASEIMANIDQGQTSTWHIKAAGRLARKGVETFLDQGEEDRPWFLFLNYMEAHRPYVPAPRYRKRFLDEARLERSYAVDLSWDAVWEYTFGLRDLSAEELAIARDLYDATLAELDDLFADLLEMLDERGELDDTIVVLAGDHGELLGEHHMLDHQYSLYEPVTHVPLVLHYPARVPAGRSTRPVMALDVFPTLLELTGIPRPARVRHAVSLLGPAADRTRLVEYPAAFSQPILSVREQHTDFDATPWRRRLRALHSGGWKLVEAEDGSAQLYDRARDPAETKDLAGTDPETLERLRGELFDTVATLRPPALDDAVDVRDSSGMLEALGYVDGAQPELDEEAEFGTDSSWSITDAAEGHE